MPTQNASKWGYVRVTGQSSHSAARNFSGTGQASANLTTDTSPAFAYQAVNTGRALQYSIYRAFYYFDTSGITGTVSAASVNIEGHTGSTGNFILVPSTAFGGDGSVNLAGDDFSRISFNTNYHTNQSPWSTTANNVLTLNSTALSDIQSNNYFICAVLQYDNDYSDVAIGGRGGQENFGIAFSTTAYLDYTVAGGGGPANVAEVNGIAVAGISTWDGNAWTDIDAINGIT